MSDNRGGITFELTSNIKAVDANVEARLRRALDRIAIKWQAEAIKAAPVDTGRLRASIAISTPNVQALHTANYSEGAVQYEPPTEQGLTAMVGTNVEYALAVHEGLPSGFAYRRNNQTVVMQVERRPDKFIEEPGRALQPTFQRMIQEELTR